MTTLRGPVHRRRQAARDRRGATVSARSLKPRAAGQRFFTGRTADARDGRAGRHRRRAGRLASRRRSVFAFSKTFATAQSPPRTQRAIDIQVTRIRRIPGKPGKRLSFKPLAKLRQEGRCATRSRRTCCARRSSASTRRSRATELARPATRRSSRSTSRASPCACSRTCASTAPTASPSGQPAYPTPNGLFAIQSKQVNPTWTAPNSPVGGRGRRASPFDCERPEQPAARALDGRQRLDRHPRHRRGLLDRDARLARLHPHARVRRDRPLRPRRRSARPVLIAS